MTSDIEKTLFLNYLKSPDRQDLHFAWLTERKTLSNTELSQYYFYLLFTYTYQFKLWSKLKQKFQWNQFSSQFLRSMVVSMSWHLFKILIDLWMLLSYCSLVLLSIEKEMGLYFLLFAYGWDHFEKVRDCFSLKIFFYFCSYFYTDLSSKDLFSCFKRMLSLFCFNKFMDSRRLDLSLVT